MDILLQPAGRLKAVTLDAAEPFSAVYIGTSGDLAITNRDGNNVVVPGLAAGVVHPISGLAVLTAGTNAGGILIQPSTTQPEYQFA